MGGEIVAIVSFMGALATIGAFVWAYRERRDRLDREERERRSSEIAAARRMNEAIEANRRVAPPTLETFSSAQMWAEVRRNDFARRATRRFNLESSRRDEKDWLEDRLPRRRRRGGRFVWTVLVVRACVLAVATLALATALWAILR